MIRKHLIIVLLLITSFLLGCSLEEDANKSNQQNETAFAEESGEQNELHTKSDAKNDERILNELVVHYIDADQGDATLFQTDEYTILYDAGDWKNENVINYLHQLNINQLDLIIISHPHADHIGQLEKIINSFSVGEVWMTENVANTKVFQHAVQAIIDNEIDYYNPIAGETFDIGDIELTVLHPNNLTGGLNEDSLSVRFTYGDVSFIFTGDAYKQQEQMIIERGYSLEAQFLQLGHHGSNTSNDPSFIKAVNPAYAIYSAGQNNQYGHPHDEVVHYFQEKNITLLGTDVHGTIKVMTDGKEFQVETEKSGEITADTVENDKKQKQSEQLARSNRNDCIDINNASIDKIKNIIHIGDVRADELITKRPYHSLDELTKIKGIGESRLNDIKEQGLACIN